MRIHKGIGCTTFVLYMLSAAAVAAQPGAGAGESADAIKQARKLNSEGKQDEAVAIYRKVLEGSPRSFDAWMGAGAALDLKGDYGSARHHFEKALEVAGADQKAQALKAMAMSYAFEANCKEAAKYEQQVFDSQTAASNFTAAAETANEAARICLESGDADAAYKWYKTGYETALRTADLKPADKDLWAFRWEHAQARVAAKKGNASEAQKQVAAAKAVFDKGTLNGQDRFVPYLTGYVAFYGGDYKTAIADLSKVNPADPFILSLLAQAEEKTGDKAGAMELYRKILASNAHNPTNAFARPLARKKVG